MIVLKYFITLFNLHQDKLSSTNRTYSVFNNPNYAPFLLMLISMIETSLKILTRLLMHFKTNRKAIKSSMIESNFLVLLSPSEKVFDIHCSSGAPLSWNQDPVTNPNTEYDKDTDDEWSIKVILWFGSRWKIEPIK